MTTGPDGQDFEVGGRLAGIRSRYGPGDVVTRFIARAEPTIVAAVRRTESRRVQRGVPVTEVAERLGTSRPAVRPWVRCYRDESLDG